MSVQRFDFRQLKFDKSFKTDSGFLKAPVFATRTGVLKYLRSDGSVIKEYRPPEEVFNEDSLRSLQGVPYTRNHPSTLVDAQNAKDHMVGFTSDIVEKMGNFVKTSVTITDSQTIKDTEDGKLRDVSCGYTCDLDLTPGTTPEGEKFDAIQRNIRYNHLAGVERGRAGPEVRIHLDAEQAILCDDDNQPPGGGAKPNQKGDYMAKVKLDGAEHEVDAGVASAINAEFKARETAARADERDKTKKQMEDEKKAEMDKLQAKADSLAEENEKLKEAKMDEAEIAKRVSARTKLISTVSSLLPEDTKFDEMTDLEIKKAVVESKSKKDSLDAEKMKSEVYVEARFDHIVENLDGAGEDTNKDLKKAVGDVATKTDEDDEKSPEAVRERRMKADSEAWKKPIGLQAKTA